MIRIIGARAGRLWPQVLQTAAEAREAGRPLVLYVPEQLTLQAERDLITGLRLPGLLDIDVISPRKLRRQVREAAGSSGLAGLGEFGHMMAVHRAMAEAADRLRYYRGAGDLPGTVSRVREALDELRESGMSAAELDEYAGTVSGGAEQAKLRDLSAIWQAFSGLTEGRFEDEKASWTDMVGRLKRSRLWAGAEVMIYGFDSIRPDLRELLIAACPQAARISVFLIMDRADAPDGQIFSEARRSAEALEQAAREGGEKTETVQAEGGRPEQGEALRWMEQFLFAEDESPWPKAEDPAPEITLFAGAEPSAEADDIAATLRRWHREGIAWSRMAVALPAGSGLENVLPARLREGGIPFFRTGRTDARSHGVCRLLLSTMACISEGYQTDEVIAAAKSGFSSLTEEEACRLENYAAAWGISRSMWQAPFTHGDDAAEAETLRQRLTAPMEELREGLKKARSAAESVEAVVRFLEAENVWERLRERESVLLEKEMYREAVVDRQVWQMLMDLLDQMWSLLGERRASIREMDSMLEAALSGAAIPVLPEQESGVVIGEVGHMLAGDTDGLILAGVREGIMSAAESGWMTDRERETMERATGREIGASRERRSMVRRCDYYRTMALPRQRLRITRSLRDEKGGTVPEDGLTGMVRRLFPAMKEEGSALASGTGEAPETPAAAMEGAGVFLDAMRNGKAVPDREAWEEALIRLIHSDTYGRTAGEMIRGIRGGRAPQQILPATARRLFMTDRVSISRLEQYAACPYRHFIDYGLRPVQRETFTFESNDAGTFFHAVLEHYINRAGAAPGWPDFTREEADRVLDGVIRELTADWEGGPLRNDALGVWQGEDYLRRVRHAAWALTRFAANSDFRTIATERRFGEADGDLKPMTLRLEDGSSVTLRGTIDRIDTYESGEGIWLRVVDNKSREKKPDAARMATGEQLQLMIYLRAAVDAYPGVRPAGALFFPVQDREIETEETDPEAIEEARLKKLRMKGMVTAERDVVRAMDRDRSPYSVDAVFNRDGSVRKGADWAVDERGMTALMDAAAEKAAELCDEIRGGYAAAAPRGKGDDLVCAYCEYRTICHFRKGDERPRTP